MTLTGVIKAISTLEKTNIIYLESCRRCCPAGVVLKATECYQEIYYIMNFKSHLVVKDCPVVSNICAVC